MKKLLQGFLAAAFLFLAPVAAQAQSGCSIFVYGTVPTPGQWNQCLQSKQDVLGYTAVNKAGDVMAGRLATIASTTSRAGFSIAPGVAPTSPVDGDFWTTTSGVFVRINGSTVGPLTATGSTIPSVVQGDLLYGSAPGVLSALSKNATATRYLSNTGTSNNPAWGQVNLANGVTGLLPLANLATGSQDTVLGYFSSTAVGAISINNCAGALTYSTSTHTFGCNASGAVVGTGTPTANQIAQWTNSTTIQGVNLVSLLAAGGGISLTGTTTVTVALANNGSTINTSPANPAVTISNTQVMMGLGKDQAGSGANPCTITPGFSTRVRFAIEGDVNNNTAGQGGAIGGRYGTGTAPSNGAAGTAGSAFLANSIGFISASNSQSLPFSVSGIVTGLTPGVPYWFDLSLSASNNTSKIENLSCKAQEF